MQIKIKWKSVLDTGIIKKYKYLVQEFTDQSTTNPPKTQVSIFHTKNFVIWFGSNIPCENIPFMTTYDKSFPFFASWVCPPNTTWYLYNDINTLTKDYFDLFLNKTLHKTKIDTERIK